MSLSDSRLITFYNEDLVLHFFEGQKLIHDLVLTQQHQGNSFGYFRDFILGVQPLITFLKPGEQLCVYLDSEMPYFRIKLETNSSGYLRAMVYPDKMEGLVDRVSGKVRLLRLNRENSYHSVIDLDAVTLGEIINLVLERSWQFHARVHVSAISDQSVMIHKLPSLEQDI
ncbi:MAG: Hsp33 family molecular chaperone HslO, partial [SAR324 cluster bacterium]|nr:Hsp33 family molecular chaperone HslO [SAR324 cluster bacterium]